MSSRRVHSRLGQVWCVRRCEHPPTLYNGGFWSLPLLFRALEAARSGFGERDPHLASATNNLAELYRLRRQPEKAEPLYLEVTLLSLHHSHQVQMCTTPMGGTPHHAMEALAGGLLLGGGTCVKRTCAECTPLCPAFSRQSSAPPPRLPNPRPCASCLRATASMMRASLLHCTTWGASSCPRGGSWRPRTHTKRRCRWR